MHYSKHKSLVFIPTFLSQWVIFLNHGGLKTKSLPLFNLFARFTWGFGICNLQGVSPICMNTLKQVTGKNKVLRKKEQEHSFQASITISHLKVYSLTINEQSPKSEYTMEHQPRLLNRAYTFKLFQLLYSSLPCRVWTSEFWDVIFANWVMASEQLNQQSKLSLFYWKELKTTEICMKKRVYLKVSGPETQKEMIRYALLQKNIQG